MRNSVSNKYGRKRDLCVQSATLLQVTMVSVLVDNIPQFQLVISVVVVWYFVQASLRDVIRQAEGAVGHLREPPLHDIKLALASKVSGLRGE